jgi:hypothetical protein
VPPRVRFQAITALLAAAALASGPALARADSPEGGGSGDPAAAPAPSPPDGAPRGEESEPKPAGAKPEEASPARGEPDPAQPREDSWVDVGHAFLEQRIFAPVVRFDRFFSDERDLEAERSRSFLRFRNEIRFTDEGEAVYAANVRADLRLPGLNRWLERLRLVIAGKTEDTVDALFPDSPGAPLREQIGSADAEVRFDAFRTLLAHMDLGAGVLLELPPGVFGRVRFRAAVPAGRLFLTRFATTGFWRTDTLFGTSGAVSFERPLGMRALARLGSSAELTQRSRGVEWGSELAVLRSFGRRSAVSLAAGLQGAERAPVAVDRYRVFARLRRDFFRHWIFLELEPEAGWPWNPVEGRHRVLAFTVRVELQFQGNESPEPPPVAEPEPADPGRDERAPGSMSDPPPAR